MPFLFIAVFCLSVSDAVLFLLLSQIKKFSVKSPQNITCILS